MVECHVMDRGRREASDRRSGIVGRDVVHAFDDFAQAIDAAEAFMGLV